MCLKIDTWEFEIIVEEIISKRYDRLLFLEKGE